MALDALRGRDEQIATQRKVLKTLTGLEEQVQGQLSEVSPCLLPLKFTVPLAAQERMAQNTYQLLRLSSACKDLARPATCWPAGALCLCCALGDWTDLNLPASPSIRPPPLPRIVSPHHQSSHHFFSPFFFSLSLTHTLTSPPAGHDREHQPAARAGAAGGAEQPPAGEAWSLRWRWVRAGRASASRQGPVCWQGAWRPGVPRRASTWWTTGQHV